MSNVTLAKFGGTPLGTAYGFQRARGIAASKRDIRIVVASAPGKANGVNRAVRPDPVKVTNVLYSVLKHELPAEEGIIKIQRRFEEIEDGLQIRPENRVSPLVHNEIMQRLNLKDDSIPALGEYLNTRLFVNYLNQTGIPARFVQPSDICFRVNEQGGKYVVDSSRYDIIGGRLRELLAEDGRVLVVPGFYGNDATGAVRTFPRGGSDYTGAVLAAGIGAKYLNYTDTDGIRVVEDEISETAPRIPWMTHRELSELTQGGKFGIFQYEAVGPLEERRVETRVLNAFSEDSQGTLVASAPEGNSRSPVAGIVHRGQLTSFKIRVPGRANQVGLVNEITSLFSEIGEERGISIEHIFTSTDDISAIVKNEQIENSKVPVPEVAERIRRRTGSRNVESHGMNIIAVVGEKMGIRTISDVFSTLADCGIGTPEFNHTGISLTLGIENGAAMRAAGALYQRFFG